MNSYWKGVLAGAIAVLAIGSMLAAAGPAPSGRYLGLEREGPVIVVDTQTGDFIVQGANGKSEGYRWAAAWKPE